MSTRRDSGSHYENHQRAAELQDAAAHAHRVAEQTRGKQDHLTPSEQSRREHEYRPEQAEHSAATFGHNDIAALAYEFWEARGDSSGSADDDWFRAVKELRTRAISTQLH